MFTTRALRHIGSIAAIAVAVFTLSGAAILFAGTGDVAAQDCDYNLVAVDGECLKPTPTPVLADSVPYTPFTAPADPTAVPNNNPVVAATPTPVATAAPAVSNTSPVPTFTG